MRHPSGEVSSQHDNFAGGFFSLRPALLSTWAGRSVSAASNTARSRSGLGGCRGWTGSVAQTSPTWSLRAGPTGAQTVARRRENRLRRAPGNRHGLSEDGVEIATDLSENRASLTRDEAHEYLVIDHTSTHKAATMPAQLVLAKVPADWATRPKDESFHKTHFVKVDKTGHPVGTFEDAACTTVATNPYCDAVLRDQLFLPALEKGRPVDSVVRIKLARLSHQ